MTHLWSPCLLLYVDFKNTNLLNPGYENMYGLSG